MTFEEWDNALADLSIELDEAAEAMGIEMSEIDKWIEKNEVPQKAIDWLNKSNDDQPIISAQDAQKNLI